MMARSKLVVLTTFLAVSGACSKLAKPTRNADSRTSADSAGLSLISALDRSGLDGTAPGCDAAFDGKNTAVKVFYVAIDGKDSNPGSLAEPFRSIERARDKVRETSKVDKPIFVLIRKGTYRLSSTLEFTSADSGTVTAPVTYRPYQCEKVTISGGVSIPISGGSWSPVADRPGVYKTNVRRLRFFSLFVNGRRAVRARTPDTGYIEAPNQASLSTERLTIGKNVTATTSARAEFVINNTWESSRMAAQTIRPDDVVEFVGKTHQPIGFWMKPRFFVENVLDGLTSADEWYLNASSDSGADDLYYKPLPNEAIADSQFVVPQLAQLVTISGAAYLNFKFLTFSDGDWSPGKYGGDVGCQSGSSIQSKNAIVFQSSMLTGDHSKNCVFEGNTVKNIGAFALQVQNSEYITIAGNEISGAGAGGVKVGPTNGEKKVDTKEVIDLCNMQANTEMFEHHIVVTNNKIHDNNAVFRGATGGVWILLGGNNTVSYNTFYNFTYTAISVGWNMKKGAVTSSHHNLIENNVIHDVMTELNDGAAIYTMGRQPYSIIQKNVIYHVVEKDHVKLASGYSALFGLYLDKASQGITVQNNLIYDMAYGLLENNTMGNQFYNNFFIKSDHPINFSKTTGTKFHKNIVSYSAKTALFNGAGWVKGAEAGTGENWGGIESSNGNLFYNPVKTFTVPAGYTFGSNAIDNAGWPATFEANSLVNKDPGYLTALDPQVAAFENQNLTLPANSPARSLGIIPVDFSQAGAMADYYRP